jgi:hypothetical protein
VEKILKQINREPLFQRSNHQNNRTVKTNHPNLLVKSNQQTRPLESVQSSRQDRQDRQDKLIRPDRSHKSNKSKVIQSIKPTGTNQSYRSIGINQLNRLQELNLDNDSSSEPIEFKDNEGTNKETNKEINEEIKSERNCFESDSKSEKDIVKKAPVERFSYHDERNRSGRGRSANKGGRIDSVNRGGNRINESAVRGGNRAMEPATRGGFISFRGINQVKRQLKKKENNLTNHI